MYLDKITLTCFGSAYAAALLLEVFHLVWPRAVPRLPTWENLGRLR